MDNHARNNKTTSRPKWQWIIPLCVAAAGLAGYLLWAAIGAGIKPDDPDWQSYPMQMQTQPTATTPSASENDPITETTTPTEGNTLPIATENDVAFLVETPYFTVALSPTLQDSMRVEQTDTNHGYVLQCYGAAGGQEHLLFTFTIGGGGNMPLGTLADENGKVLPIFVDVQPLPEDSTLNGDNRQALLTMQDEVNTFLSAIYAHPGFSTSTPPTQAQPIDLTVSTSFGNFTIPMVWEECMRAVVEPETGGESVTFFGDVAQAELPLFSVFLGTDPGGADLVGFLSLADGAKTPVSLLLYDCPTGDSYSPADKAKFQAMQEEVNHILSELDSWTSFTPA